MDEHDNEDRGSDSEMRRRSVLAKLGTGSIAGLVSFSGQAIAESDLEKDKKAKQHINTYSSESNVEEAVETYASELVDELHSQGHIETDSISDIVGDPIESEYTTVRVFPDEDNWTVDIIIQVTEIVELAVSPTRERSHAKIDDESNPSITTAEKLTTNSGSEPTFGTNNHNGTCYASYDTCYAGFDPEGSTTCTVIEVYQCDGACVTHPTRELCNDCTIGDPYPCQ